jgi:hypothetical protein
VLEAVARELLLKTPQAEEKRSMGFCDDFLIVEISSGDVIARSSE